MRVFSKEEAAARAHIEARINELHTLQDGWCDGQGVAYTPNQLHCVKAAAEMMVFQGIPDPYIFPTPEGSIQLAWSWEQYEVTVEICFDRTGVFRFCDESYVPRPLDCELFVVNCTAPNDSPEEVPICAIHSIRGDDIFPLIDELHRIHKAAMAGETIPPVQPETNAA